MGTQSGGMTSFPEVAQTMSGRPKHLLVLPSSQRRMHHEGALLPAAPQFMQYALNGAQASLALPTVIFCVVQSNEQ
jgi:hypothetical protein